MPVNMDGCISEKTVIGRHSLTALEGLEAKHYNSVIPHEKYRYLRDHSYLSNPAQTSGLQN